LLDHLKKRCPLGLPAGVDEAPGARARDPGTHNGRGHLPWTVHRSELARPSAKRSGRRWAGTSETHSQHGQGPRWFLPLFLSVLSEPPDLPEDDSRTAPRNRRIGAA